MSDRVPVTLPDERRRLAVILVSYNTKHLLDSCLEALSAALVDLPGTQIVVVDNASRDGSADHLQATWPTLTLLRLDSNVGFGRANNAALKHIDAEHVLLLNTDAFVDRTSIVRTLDHMDCHPECGIAGARLTGRDGALQPSCRYFPTPWNTFLVSTGLARWLPHGRLVDDMDWDHASMRNCDWVPGCYYMVRGRLIDEVGLFDERYFLYYEEVDHCQAARKAGWQVTYLPDVAVVHLGGESARSEGPISAVSRQIDVLEAESALLYFRKHAGATGVALHLVLDVLASVIIAAKAIARLRARPVAEMAKRLVTQARALTATAAGSRSNR